MDKDSIKKAFDYFENEKYVEAKEILRGEIKKAKEDYFSDELGLSEQANLSGIMKKVSAGTELNSEEEEMLTAAIDAAKEGEEDEENMNVLSKIASKISKGTELTPDEEKILSAALKASK
jgi:hypothetical protein